MTPSSRAPISNGKRCFMEIVDIKKRLGCICSFEAKCGSSDLGI
jgi:hypothetical protein